MLEKHVIHPYNPFHLILHEPGEHLKLAPQSRSVLAQTAASPIADTFGWDTVFAIRLPDLNNAIKTTGSSPKAFKEDLGGGYTIEGGFDTWRVSRGGDGRNLFLETPINSGTMMFNKVAVSLEGVSATVEIGLDFLPLQSEKVPPPSQSGSSHDLKPNLISNNQEQAVASVVNVRRSSGEALDAISKALIQGALNSWFNKHLDQFDHTFSIVNLNLLADNESFQWLKPSTSSYAYADGPDDHSSVFGVLSTTEQRSIAELDHSISPAAFQEGMGAGFLINSRLFLRESVLKGLPKAFAGASESDFQMTNSHSEIIKNPHATVKLNPVTYNSVDYQPILNSFNLSLADTEIVIKMQLKVNVFPGVDSIIDTTYYYTLELVDKPDGRQTLGFKQTRKPEIVPTKHVAPEVKVTFILLEIIGGLVGLLTGGAEDIVEFIITGVIVAVIVGVIEGIELLITDVLTNGVANAMPAINPMIFAATDPISWPTQQSKFTLTSVRLNGAIQLGGNLNFAS
ncbi:MAG: TULIP family P47-like protein [Bacteroidota bacterium]